MPRFVLPLLAILLAIPPDPGMAQNRATLVCGQRDQIIGQLRSRFGEELQAMGLAGPTRILEVFASETTGSWTIAITSVDGTTCLMASGQHYQAAPTRPPGEPL